MSTEGGATPRSSNGPPGPSTTGGLREFILDNVIVAGAQLLTKLRAVLTLPLVVHTLGTTGYGVWSQVLAFVAFLAGVVGWNLHLPLVRMISANRADAPRAYSTILLATVALSLASCLVVLPFTGDIGHLLLGVRGLETYLAAGLALVLFGNVRAVAFSVYRATGRFVVRSLFDFIGALGELAGILLTLKLGHGLGGALTFMVAWNAAQAVAVALHAATIAGWGRVERGILAEAFRFSTPLVPAGLSMWLLDRGDRFVIGHYLGPSGVGIYSASYALGAMLLTLQAPLQLTLFPKVTQLWDRDRATARQYILLSNKLFLTLSIPCVAAIPFVAPIALSRFANAEIARGSGPLTFLVALGVTLWGVTIMQTQVFYASKRTRAIGIISMVAAAGNLALNFLLVPRLGVLGAAIATTVSFGGTCLAMFVTGRTLMPFDLYPAHLLKCAVSAAGAAAAITAISPGSLATLFPALALAGCIYLAGLIALRAYTAQEVALGRRVVRGLRRRSAAG